MAGDLHKNDRESLAEGRLTDRVPSLGTKCGLLLHFKSKNEVTEVKIEKKINMTNVVFFHTQNSDIRGFSHLSIPFIPEAYC